MLRRVREEDKLGNAEADTTADWGGRLQSEAVMDARRVLLNARVLVSNSAPASPLHDCNCPGLGQS